MSQITQSNARLWQAVAGLRLARATDADVAGARAEFYDARNFRQYSRNVRLTADELEAIHRRQRMEHRELR